MSGNMLEAESENSSDTTSIVDSLYDSEEASITDTLTSAWKAERNTFVRGRRYHKTEKGEQDLTPNDDEQLDQMDLYHQIYIQAMSLDVPEGQPPKLYLAPIGLNPHRVLDVGTGTGIWAIDFADAHASAEVIGFDVTPIQPTWVPPNLKFEIEDVEKEWTWTAGSFDLVHARSMQSVITDWPKFCGNAFKALKPGGYLEVYTEVPQVCSDDDTVPKDWPWVVHLELVSEGLAKINRKLLIEDTIEKDMKEAGFVNIKQEWFKVPIGPWPKDPKLKQLGAMYLVNILQGVEGWTFTIFTQMLNKSEEETHTHVATVKKTLKNKKVHAYLKFHNIVGQKPTA